MIHCQHYIYKIVVTFTLTRSKARATTKPEWMLIMLMFVVVPCNNMPELVLAINYPIFQFVYNDQKIKVSLCFTSEYLSPHFADFDKKL